MGQSSSDNASLAVCPNFSSSFQAISTLSETVGHASERLSSNSLCSSPDDPNSDGAKMEETEPGQLRMVFQQSLSGAVLHVCPYLGRYVLASAGNTVSFILRMAINLITFYEIIAVNHNEFNLSYLSDLVDSE